MTSRRTGSRPASTSAGARSTRWFPCPARPTAPSWSATLTSGNDDTGIQVYSGSTGTIVRRNVTYDNGDHGVDLNYAGGTRVISNTSAGNFTLGLNVEGNSTNVTLRNNISVDDATNSPRGKGNIRVEAGSETGTTIDRDLVFQSVGSSTLIAWAGTNYSTLSAAQTGTGQEAHGISQDPRFGSLAGRDLRLTAGSPALDTADSSAPSWSAKDRVGNAPVDDPRAANTGAGPTTYADLGALELVDVPAPVDAPPVAALTATPAALTAGGSTTLDAGGSTDDKGITGYTFGCDNGTAPVSGTQATRACSYPTAGTYHPTVTVKDAANQTSQATTTVTVTAPPPPPPLRRLRRRPRDRAPRLAPPRPTATRWAG